MTEQDLINKIQLLKQITPKEEWVVSTRAKLAFRMEMARKKNLLNKDLFALKELFSTWTANEPKFAFSPVYGVIIAFGLVLGGGAVTGIASMQSAPGSPLYSVKLSVERARLATSFSEEGKIQLQAQIVDNRLNELSAVVANNDSVDQKAEKVTQVVNNIKEQLASANDQLSKSNQSEPKKVVEAAKVISEKASQFSKALATVQESLPESIKPELAVKIAEVTETGKQADMKYLETMIANQDSVNVNKEDIIAKLNDQIQSTQEQVTAREQKIVEQLSFADKLPIRAVLVNQTQQSRDLLEKAKQAVADNDLAGALQFIKAVKAIETGAEKMVQNADRAISDEETKLQSQNTSSPAVESLK
ncbi:MAG: DUF5667 domain-containing protein [bacterium]|nr:DUF5667 domain-containing protein [bacterium]